MIVCCGSRDSSSALILLIRGVEQYDSGMTNPIVPLGVSSFDALLRTLQ